MELTEQQIDFIREDLENKGITFSELNESMLDHICCCIENSSAPSFGQAYNETLKLFGNEGIGQIQKDTIFLLIIKRVLIMKKTMFIFGYIAAILSSTGLLFKLQHWPGAAVLLTLGIVLLNFGFLPLYFYDRYKHIARH